MAPSHDGAASPYDERASSFAAEEGEAVMPFGRGNQKEGGAEADLDEADVLFDRLTFKIAACSQNPSPDDPNTARNVPSEQEDFREGEGMAIPTTTAAHAGFHVGSFKRSTHVWPEEDPHGDDSAFVCRSAAMEGEEEEEVGSSLRPDLRRRLHLKCHNEGPSTLAFSLSFVNRGGELSTGP
jgi:hypothetical protein